jgi:hypothetical protein
MSKLSPSTFYRVQETSEVIAGVRVASELILPTGLAAKIKPGDGLIIAGWDEGSYVGTANILCVVVSVDVHASTVGVEWRQAKIILKPNPSGRRWWRNPYLCFAPEVVKRYMLHDEFEKHFANYADIA